MAKRLMHAEEDGKEEKVVYDAGLSDCLSLSRIPMILTSRLQMNNEHPPSYVHVELRRSALLSGSA